MSERITIKGARRTLAHYARTLAGHGIMPAEEAGRMRLGNPYGQCLYVYTHDVEGYGISHNVPGFCGSSKALGTSPKEARDMIYQAHNTIGDLYRHPAPFDHEAGDAAHRAVMEHYGLWNEYAKIFKVDRKSVV